MTLVTITLTEEEQKLLLVQAGNIDSHYWQSIAEKIRKARDGSMFQGFSLNEELE